MAFLKQANAMVVHPRVSGRGWKRTRRVASSGATNRNLTDQAREILGGSLDPDKYLFSHCTIVASVDTEAPPDVKLGKIKSASSTRMIDRRYADYQIKPDLHRRSQLPGARPGRGEVQGPHH
jgi:DNA repair exonuclease SbcCD nuclease subunit